MLKEPRKLNPLDEIKVSVPRGAKREALIQSGRLTIDQALAAGLDKIFRRLSGVFQTPMSGDSVWMKPSEESVVITKECDWGDCSNRPIAWRFDRKRNWLPA